MYSAEAFIKCTNDKIKRTEASENHLEDSIEPTQVDFNHLKVQNELFIADIEAKK